VKKTAALATGKQGAEAKNETQTQKSVIGKEQKKAEPQKKLPPTLQESIAAVSK
jgi:hypothetical protein